MSDNSTPLSSEITDNKLREIDLTDCCRICKCRKENGIKLRPLFNGRRLTRIIANTIHMEVRRTRVCVFNVYKHVKLLFVT